MLPLMYGWAGLGRSINIVIYFQDKETVSSVSTTVLLPQIITHLLSGPCQVSTGSHHLLLELHSQSATLALPSLCSSHLFFI